MGEINLDEARAARAEKLESQSFVFKGETFELPPELPYEALGPIGLLVDNERNLLALRQAMIALLGEEGHARFEALGPAIADMNVLVGGIFESYGLGTPAKNGANGEVDPKSPPS